MVVIRTGVPKGNKPDIPVPLMRIKAWCWFGESAESIADQWNRLGLDIRLPDLLYADGHNIVADYLERLGWEVGTQTRPEIFAAYGRPFHNDDAAAGLQTSLNITATRK